MKHIIKTILSCYLLVLANGVFAQTFPIQLTPQSIPPQPIYLSDYANTNTTIDRLRLQVLLNDLTVPNLDVKLRIYVEGEGIMTRSNDLVIGAVPIILESGSPLQLRSIDLAPYFEFRNLQGINPNVYANALPEGIYNFCYEVYDAFTGIALSQKTCSTVVIFQNEPPFLNLPLDNSVIKQQDTYNILFQWTPRHINVSNTQYEFSLVQIFDNYVDPQAAFLSSQPIFQTQLSQTSLLYDLRFPPLLEGYRYAWRVRAFASNGAEEIGLFINQGYSEIWSFTYTRPCNEVSSFTEESIFRDRAKITWDGDPQHLDYTISYREKHAGSDWYIRKTPREYITIDALRPATTYEYKIAGNCEFGGFTYNTISEFTTLAEETPDNRYVCNIPPEKVDLSNQSLLDEIYVNDLFFANDFPITVLELTSSSPPFSGLGYIGIPWLNIARVGVEFKDIQINTDFKMVQGVVQTAYDPDWSNVEFIDQYLDFTDRDNDLDEETVPFVIATVEVADGEIIVTGVNGVVITYPTDDDTNVIDSDGTTYVITAGSEDIESVEPSEIGEGGRIDPANTDGFSGNGTLSQLSSEGIKVTFEDVSNAKYGFDKLPNVPGLPQSVLAQYEKTKDGSGANYYYIHKAVEKGITDKLKAKITTNDNTLLERLVFKTAQGILIPHDLNSNKTEATVTVKGLYNDEAETIYAAIVNRQDSTETIAGAFKLHHLPAAQTNDIKPVNVTVLTMNTVDTSDIHSAIKNQIKAIYKKAAVYNIQFAENENIKIDPSVWGGGDIEVGDSGPLAHYSADQRAIRDAIKESMTIDPKMYYLVVTDVPPNRLNYNGFMPLGGQFGFIFKNSNNSSDEAIAKVMAHELGHGAFGLKHQFPKENKEGLGTNWLMDYTPIKSDMNHMDWKQIHDPKWQTYLFQGDDAGASVTLSSHFRNYGFSADVFGHEHKAYIFLTPSGHMIPLKEDVQNVQFFYGYYGDSQQKNFISFMNYTPGTLKSFKNTELIDGQSTEIIYEAKIKSWTNMDSEDADKISRLYGYFESDGNGNFVKDGRRYRYPYELQVSSYGNADSVDPIVLMYNGVNFMMAQVDAKNGFTPNLSFYNYGKSLLKSPYEFPVIDGVLANDKQVQSMEDIAAGENSNLQSGAQWVSSQIVGYSENENIFLLNKIMEIKASYPEFVEYVTKDFSNWDICKPDYEDEQDHTFENYLFKTYCDQGVSLPTGREMLKEYIRFLKNRIDSQNISTAGLLRKIVEDDTGTKVIDATDNDQFVKAINFASPAHIQTLKGNHIIRILSKFAKGNIFGDSDPSQDTENAVVRLIEYVNPMEAKAVIDGLESVNVYHKHYKLALPKLYYNLFKKVDNERFGFFGENNRGRLIKSLTTLAYKAAEENQAKIKELDDNLEKRSFVFEYRNIVKRIIGFGALTNPQIARMIASNKFYKKEDLISHTIDADYDYETGLINASQEIQIALFPNFLSDYKGEFQSNPLSPFDLVFFQHSTRLDGFDEFAPRGVPQILPAIVLLYADQTATDKTTFDSVSLAVDLASLSTGVGALAKTANNLRRAVILADMASDISGIYLTSMSDEELNYWQEKLQGAVAAYGVLRLTTAGASTIKNIYTKINSIPELPIATKVLDDLEAMSDDLFDEIGVTDEVFMRYASYLAKLEANTNSNSLKNRVNVLLDKLKTINLRKDDAFFSRMNLKNPEFIKANYNTLLEEFKTAFRADFASASQEVLTQLNKTDSTLFNIWKSFRARYPNKSFCN